MTRIDTNYEWEIRFLVIILWVKNKPKKGDRTTNDTNRH